MNFNNHASKQKKNNIKPRENNILKNQLESIYYIVAPFQFAIETFTKPFILSPYYHGKNLFNIYNIII